MAKDNRMQCCSTGIQIVVLQLFLQSAAKFLYFIWRLKRCFDLRVPEEINRKIVDHTSDINMTHTEHARRYLLSRRDKARNSY